MRNSISFTEENLNKINKKFLIAAIIIFLFTFLLPILINLAYTIQFDGKQGNFIVDNLIWYIFLSFIVASLILLVAKAVLDITFNLPYQLEVFRRDILNMFSDSTNLIFNSDSTLPLYKYLVQNLREKKEILYPNRNVKDYVNLLSEMLK